MAAAAGSGVPCFAFIDRFQTDLDAIYEKYSKTSTTGKGILLSDLDEPEKESGATESDSESAWESDSSGPSFLQQSSSESAVDALHKAEDAPEAWFVERWDPLSLVSTPQCRGEDESTKNDGQLFNGRGGGNPASFSTLETIVKASEDGQVRPTNNKGQIRLTKQTLFGSTTASSPLKLAPKSPHPTSPGSTCRARDSSSNTRDPLDLAQAVFRTRHRIATALAQESIDNLGDGPSAEPARSASPISAKHVKTVKHSQMNKGKPISVSREFCEVRHEQDRIVGTEERTRKNDNHSQRCRSIDVNNGQRKFILKSRVSPGKMHFVPSPGKLRTAHAENKNIVRLHVPLKIAGSPSRLSDAANFRDQITPGKRRTLKLQSSPVASCVEREESYALYHSKRHLRVDRKHTVENVQRTAICGVKVKGQIEFSNTDNDIDGGPSFLPVIANCRRNSSIKQRFLSEDVSRPLVNSEDSERDFERLDSLGESDSSSLSLPSIPCSPILPAGVSQKRPLDGNMMPSPNFKRRKVSRKIRLLNSESKEENDANTGCPVISTSLSSSCCRTDRPCGKAFCFECVIVSQ